MPNNIFQPYVNTASYEMYDVIFENPIYYYATASSTGEKPTSQYLYNIGYYTRQDNLITVYFLGSGSSKVFNRGSMVMLNNTSDSTIHYTGMVIHGGTNFIQYLNPGNNVASGTISAGQVKTFLNPYWTTGFFFTPSYSSSLEKTPVIIEAVLGDGYSQRQKVNLNNNPDIWKLSFQGRSDKETLAIQTFFEDKGGVVPFKLLMPVNRLVNNPNLQYIGQSLSIPTNAYNINDINVDVKQVFDIS